MMGVSGTVLLLEGGFAVVFMTLLLHVRSNGGGRADILWGFVWATRMFASLNGSRHMSGDQAELFTYVGLQACAGLSLMLILARHERKAFKDKLLRRLVVNMTEAEAVASPRSLPRTVAGPRQAPLPGPPLVIMSPDWSAKRTKSALLERPSFSTTRWR